MNCEETYLLSPFRIKHVQQCSIKECLSLCSFLFDIIQYSPNRCSVSSITGTNISYSSIIMQSVYSKTLVFCFLQNTCDAGLYKRLLIKTNKYKISIEIPLLLFELCVNCHCHHHQVFIMSFFHRASTKFQKCSMQTLKGALRCIKKKGALKKWGRMV